MTKTTIGAVGEINWIDLVYDDGCQTVDFSNFINKKLDELFNPPQEKVQEMTKESELTPPVDGEKNEEGEGDAQVHIEPEAAHELESKAFILEFGPETMKSLLNHTNDAMKIFWDGSISLYPDTFAQENNRSMTLDLLRIRSENEERTEPKYSLIHSEETEQIVNQAMTKIKLDQMDNKDAEGSMGEGYNESGSMTSTFQQDNVSPAVFICNEGKFTLKLLQGFENRCLMNMDEHPALTKEQIEEDLALL